LTYSSSWARKSALALRAFLVSFIPLLDHRDDGGSDATMHAVFKPKALSVLSLNVWTIDFLLQSISPSFQVHYTASGGLCKGHSRAGQGQTINEKSPFSTCESELDPVKVKVPKEGEPPRIGRFSPQYVETGEKRGYGAATPTCSQEDLAKE